MPWKASGSEFSFRGPIWIWMKEFHAWYPEDVGPWKQTFRFNFYLEGIAAAYTRRAKEQWEKGVFSKGKARKVMELMERYQREATQPSGFGDLLDVVDFLADNLDEQVYRAWADDCRREIRAAFQTLIDRGAH